MLDGIDNVRRLKTILEMHCATEQCWNKHSHELAKNVAERQKLQEAYGMKKPFRPPIFGELTLNRINAGQNIAMRKHHSARLCRGAGSKHDLRRIITAELHRCIDR